MVASGSYDRTLQEFLVRPFMFSHLLESSSDPVWKTGIPEVIYGEAAERLEVVGVQQLFDDKSIVQILDIWTEAMRDVHYERNKTNQ